LASASGYDGVEDMISVSAGLLEISELEPGLGMPQLVDQQDNGGTLALDA
jgi:hypothetical protein